MFKFILGSPARPPQILCEGKVVPAHGMKAYGGVELYLHSPVTLAVDGVMGQLHATAPLPPGEELQILTD
jgi:hypothetical protein